MALSTQTLQVSQLRPKEFFWLSALKCALDEIEVETGLEDIDPDELIYLVWAKIGPPPIDAALDWLAGKYAEQMLAALDRATAPTFVTR